MFKKFKRNTAINRLIEERLYEQALNELESGMLRGGLWAKALANSSGDEKKARGLYLKYRVQAMIDETEVAGGIAEEIHEDANPLHISNYRALADFSKYKRVPEDKLIIMIRDGFYQGRLFNEQWYVHKSEFI